MPVGVQRHKSELSEVGYEQLAILAAVPGNLFAPNNGVQVVVGSLDLHGAARGSLALDDGGIRSSLKLVWCEEAAVRDARTAVAGV